MKEISMPKLSDTMTEGAVVAWQKAVGDRVERGDVLAEVETDKATMELEAFASGTLLEIRVPAGETVPVGTVIGVIGEQGEQLKASAVATVQPQPATEPAVEVSADPSAAAALEPADKSQQPGAKEQAPPADSAAADGVLAAPIVRRFAKQLGIDLVTVRGSGPGGRILLDDLTAVPAENNAATGEPGADLPTEAPDRPAEAPVRKPGKAAALETPGLASAVAQPLTRMRAAIARTVSESWRTIPHFSVTVEVRMEAAERFRRELKAAGTQASMTALLIMAAAQALRKFPQLNASLQDTTVIVHPEVNIGIVTRTDGGLLVPVLRDCGSLSLAEVADRVAQLVDRARQGHLSDTELTGGTFAVSNLGMYEVHSFVALILPPMAAVMAIGATRDAVVAEAGRAVVTRILSLTLSADHRLVDGVYAAEFLGEVKHLLEQPEALAEGVSTTSP